MIIIPRNKIYNSYIIETANIEIATKTVFQYIEKFGFKKGMIEENSHPDLLVVERAEKKQSISIKQIREKLIDKIDTIPTIADRKIFIIKVDTILSEEIQNTILKTLEEPPNYVSIFIIIKNRELLLDTVKSRCFYIRDDEFNISIGEVKENSYIEDIIKVIVDLNFKDSYDIIDLSKILSNIKSNDEFKKMLLYILYLTRDAFYYKKTYDKKNIILKEKETEVLSMATNYNYEAFGKLIDNVEDGLESVDKNVDKQLLIESILLQTKMMMK